MRTAPRLAPELHRRASAWHRQHGNVDEAIAHATAAGDFGDAGELIARHWRPVWSQGQFETVVRWLDALRPRAPGSSGRRAARSSSDYRRTLGSCASSAPSHRLRAAADRRDGSHEPARHGGGGGSALGDRRHGRPPRLAGRASERQDSRHDPASRRSALDRDGSGRRLGHGASGTLRVGSFSGRRSPRTRRTARRSAMRSSGRRPPRRFRPRIRPRPRVRSSASTGARSRRCRRASPTAYSCSSTTRASRLSRSRWRPSTATPARTASGFAGRLPVFASAARRKHLARPQQAGGRPDDTPPHRPPGRREGRLISRRSNDRPGRPVDRRDAPCAHDRPRDGGMPSRPPCAVGPRLTG